MRFGMMYLFSEFGTIPQAQVFKEFIEEVELAEELGFDSVWLPEHHFSVYGILGDTLTLAAALAQRTKRIKIGTAVVLLPLQHPVRVAEQAALVDCLSEGRLLLEPFPTIRANSTASAWIRPNHGTGFSKPWISC